MAASSPTPNKSSAGRALSISPLVAIAHGTRAPLSAVSNSRAPGSARTCGTERELRLPLEIGESGTHVIAETSDDATAEVEQPTARQVIESIAADGDERYASRRRTAGGRRVVHRRQHFEPGLEVVIGVDLFRREDRRPRQFGRLVHCLVRDSQDAANVWQVLERPEENFLGAGQRVPRVTRE